MCAAALLLRGLGKLEVRQDVVRFAGEAGGLLPSRRYCQPSHSHTRAVAANIATSRGLIRSSGPDIDHHRARRSSGLIARSRTRLEPGDACSGTRAAHHRCAARVDADFRLLAAATNLARMAVLGVRAGGMALSRARP